MIMKAYSCALVLLLSRANAFAPSASSSLAPATLPEDLDTMLRMSTAKIRPFTSPTPASSFGRLHKKSKMRRQRATSCVKSQRRVDALLTKDEELQYAYAIRTFRAATQLRESLVESRDGVYVHPTEAQWATACGTSIADLRRVIENGRDARAALVAANVGLVTSIAKKQYSSLRYATQAGGGVGTILSLHDCIQEGNLGLMEAAERFQPEKNCRFSTYATWWVRQRILQSISDSSRTIRLPAHVHDTLHKIRKATISLTKKLSREPTLTELAKFMDIPEAKLKRYTDSSRNVVSLERPMISYSSKDDHVRTLGDTLASDEKSPVEDAVLQSMQTAIRNVLENELADIERTVLQIRYGLSGYDRPRSVAQTAELMNVSRDRVRLVEAKALQKLRRPSNYKLKDFMDESSELDLLEETFAKSPSSLDASASSISSSHSSSSPERMWFF